MTFNEYAPIPRYVDASTWVADPPDGVAVYTNVPGTAGAAIAFSTPVPSASLTCSLVAVGVQITDVGICATVKLWAAPEFDPVKLPFVAYVAEMLWLPAGSPERSTVATPFAPLGDSE